MRKNLHFKQEWLNQTIRIYAFIENPNHKVGNTFYFYTPMEFKEEGLIDVSDELFALLIGAKAKAVYHHIYNAINEIANLGRGKLDKIDEIPARMLYSQETRSGIMKN
ncbi:hypothetical protein [Helicobacter sp. MIT 14-3879]|uniref:hypothetical protein n=1 Tax=Helicobacter sp. MIT 14-3879 TaxID=2040649 RepID=UPI002161EA21|nr:hypothetical protein [Helicobacter sp. MIT 14-3879]